MIQTHTTNTKNTIGMNFLNTRLNSLFGGSVGLVFGAVTVEQIIGALVLGFFGAIGGGLATMFLRWVYRLVTKTEAE